MYVYIYIHIINLGPEHRVPAIHTDVPRFLKIATCGYSLETGSQPLT